MKTSPGFSFKSNSPSYKMLYDSATYDNLLKREALNEITLQRILVAEKYRQAYTRAMVVIEECNISLADAVQLPLLHPYFFFSQMMFAERYETDALILMTKKKKKN